MLEPVYATSCEGFGQTWRDVGMFFFGLRIPEHWQCSEVVVDVVYMNRELVPVIKGCTAIPIVRRHA